MEILSKIASSPARRRRAFSSESDGSLCAKKGDIPGEIWGGRTHPPKVGGVYIHLCRYVLLYVCYVSYACYM